MASEPPKDGVIQPSPGNHVWFGERLVTCMSRDHARELSSELLAAREMREVLAECEWSGHSHAPLPQCPCCENSRTDGHSPDCRLARLIARKS